jgi:hypothetical protein
MDDGRPSSRSVAEILVGRGGGGGGGGTVFSSANGGYVGNLRVLLEI